MTDTFFTTSGSSPGGAEDTQYPSPDVLVILDGSVVLFQLCSDAAHAFVSDNVQLESWQWLGTASFACDRRFAPGVATGMSEHGLRVEVCR